MSQAALALAVRDKIRAALGVDASGCRFMLDGQPPGWAGEQWVSVHYGAGQAEYAEGLVEDFGVQVTLTRRGPYSPEDQAGEEILVKAVLGMDAVVRKIVAAVLSDLDTGPTDLSVLNRANVYIGAGASGICQRFLSADEGRPVPKRADWFGARDGGRGTAYSGFAQTVTFTEAKRVQSWESAA